MLRNKRIIAVVATALLVAVLLAVLLPTGPTIKASGRLSIAISNSTFYTAGDEVIEKRTQTSKTTYLGNGRYALDTKIGSVHYRNKPGDASEPWKEINNQFVPAFTYPWDWQMLEDGYKTYVLEDFTAGQVLKFEYQGSTVAFQPMGLLWTNSLDQLQQISMPQNVPASITNTPVELLPDMSGFVGAIRWDNAYGAGRHFEWTNTPGRLNKVLQLDTSPPAPPQYILDGGNPVLKLDFIFDPSSDLDIYVDKQLWDKNSKKQTGSVIEFKKAGSTLWYFLSARYWDSALEASEGLGTTELRRVGNSLYVSTLVPYSWLQTATYPVFIDPSIQTHTTPKTLYFESVELSSKVWQASESAPSSANEATSVKNGTATANKYFAFIPGVSNNAVNAAAFIEGDAGGAHGWRSANPYSGSFLIGNWTIAFKLKNMAKYAHAGQVVARVYKTTVADPAVGDLVKLNATDGVSATVTFTATAGQEKTGTVNVWVNQNLMLDNEYLVIILNWKVVTAGSNAQAGVLCVVNEGSAEQVVTTDYAEGSPLEVQVGASADDAREKEDDGSMSLTASDIINKSNTEASLRMWGGYRFVSDKFPPKDTIPDVAYTINYVDNAVYDDANFNIHFQMKADPAAFTTTVYDITGAGRVRTEASVAWIADGIAAAGAGGVGWKNSPSLLTGTPNSPVEELWAAYSPTAVVIITRPNQDASKALWVRAWDDTTDPTNTWGAILHLEWSVGEEPEISNLPATYDFEIVTAGTTPNTGNAYFTITNDSTMAIDINIKCGGWSGAVAWSYGAPDENTGQLNASSANGGAGGSGGQGLYDVIVLNGIDSLLCDGVGIGVNPTWELQLEAPTSYTHGNKQTTIVTVTAVAD